MTRYPLYPRTNEHRPPKNGEWFEDAQTGSPIQAVYDWPDKPENHRWILRRIEEPAETWPKWYKTGDGNVVVLRSANPGHGTHYAIIHPDGVMAVQDWWSPRFLDECGCVPITESEAREMIAQMQPKPLEWPDGERRYYTACVGNHSDHAYVKCDGPTRIGVLVKVGEEESSVEQNGTKLEADVGYCRDRLTKEQAEAMVKPFDKSAMLSRMAGLLERSLKACTIQECEQHAKDTLACLAEYRGKK